MYSKSVSAAVRLYYCTKDRGSFFIEKNLGKKPVTQVSSVPSLANELKLTTLSVRPVEDELRELQGALRAQRLMRSLFVS